MQFKPIYLDLEEKLSRLPINSGQIILTLDTQKLYFDANDTQRKLIGANAVTNIDIVNGDLSITKTDGTNVTVDLSSISSGGSSGGSGEAGPVTGVKGEDEVEYRTGNVNITKANLGLSNVENKSSANIRNEITKENIVNGLGYEPISSDLIGAPSGVAGLDENGKIKTDLLPETNIEYPISIEKGGTGATDGEKALVNLLNTCPSQTGVSFYPNPSDSDYILLKQKASTGRAYQVPWQRFPLMYNLYQDERKAIVNLNKEGFTRFSTAKDLNDNAIDDEDSNNYRLRFGVEGILPISKGGTGENTKVAAIESFVGALNSDDVSQNHSIDETNLNLIYANASLGEVKRTSMINVWKLFAGKGADKLTTARTFSAVNLESTSNATFDGTGNVSLGVTGTLPIKNGGTGATKKHLALYNLINCGYSKGSSDFLGGEMIPGADTTTKEGWYTSLRDIKDYVLKDVPTNTSSMWTGGDSLSSGGNKLIYNSNIGVSPDVGNVSSSFSGNNSLAIGESFAGIINNSIVIGKNNACYEGSFIGIVGENNFENAKNTSADKNAYANWGEHIFILGSNNETKFSGSSYIFGHSNNIGTYFNSSVTTTPMGFFHNYILGNNNTLQGGNNNYFLGHHLSALDPLTEGGSGISDNGVNSIVLLGHYNAPFYRNIDANSAGNVGDALVIGNGKSGSTSNCFKVNYTGVVTGKNFNSSGADYAEMFEWEDQNIDNEDRRGLFVALNGNKIHIAKSNEIPIGTISTTAAIVGNNPLNYKNFYCKDEFEEPILDENNNYKTNPDYDNTKIYIERDKRNEWGIVGLYGQLIVIDDGTCQVNGYCVNTDGGIATASDNGYLVIERLDKTHIRILSNFLNTREQFTKIQETQEESEVNNDYRFLVLEETI